MVERGEAGYPPLASGRELIERANTESSGLMRAYLREVGQRWGETRVSPEGYVATALELDEDIRRGEDRFGEPLPVDLLDLDFPRQLTVAAASRLTIPRIFGERFSSAVKEIFATIDQQRGGQQPDAQL